MKKPSFRGAPFWAWNAKLNPTELRRQIRTMKDMGLGGFFMHSRVGLDTPYLGDDWFKCVKACVDEAKKTGMDAWIYDEDRWPSGAAGGLVTKNHPEFAPVGILYCREGEELPADATPIADFIITGFDAGTIKSFKRVKGGTKTKKSTGEIFRFYRFPHSPTSWYNDCTYLDVLSKKAVAEFIRVTYDKYKSEVGDDFGKTIPGVFTDEPNYTFNCPWTPALEAEFKKRQGCELADCLPEIFFFVGDEKFSRARWNYLDAVTQLFATSFWKQIGDWCGKNDLMFTGHGLCEEKLAYQSVRSGDMMRYYEHMQAPGMDQLTEHQSEYRTAKQLSSVARQFGARTRLSETYGCTGWDFSMEAHKAIGDWQMACGVNLRCQHLAWYSMEAQAKRDYPAGIFDHSPWWKIYPVCEDYFARIGEALTQGAERRDTLVIHPIESAWGLRGGYDKTKPFAFEAQGGPVEDLEARFVDTFSALLSANLDFDFGCEDIMARHGKTLTQKDGVPALKINRATYTSVVIPPLQTIRASTLALLEKFADIGGFVFYVDDHPRFVDGRESKALGKAFAKFHYVKLAQLAGNVAPVSRLVSITENGRETPATLFNLVEAKNKKSLTVFVCNTSIPMPTQKDEFKAPLVRDRTLEYPGAVLRVSSPDIGCVCETDLLTGESKCVPYKYENGAYVIPCGLIRLQTRLFTIGECGTDIPVCAKNKISNTDKNVCATFTDKNVCATLDEPNVLLLDNPTAFIDGKPFGEPNTFVMSLDKALRAELGVRPRGGAMVQPWAAPKGKPKRKLALTLEYKFECAKIPAAPVSLALERPDLYKI
ncbi:MAG: hypothetical protein FWG05_02355, partial [Kiritimatiellaeota bacterium]|nr:hypothetical protein [Kiritimatiellota bacterium]